MSTLNNFPITSNKPLCKQLKLAFFKLFLYIYSVIGKSSLPSAPKNCYAVILAGGGGTRLWPKSRKKAPKHLLNITGEDTLIRLTYQRISKIFPKERIFLITLKDHLSSIEKQLPNFPKENIIVEPASRNTALAMGVASAYIKKKDPNAIVFNSAADHLITDLDKFHRTVLVALESAQKGKYIVAVAIRPTFPHTGFGYIRVGEQIGKVRVMSKDMFVFKSKGFKEKPDIATAQSFVASGQYLWNANYYVWSVETIFEAFKDYSPEIYKYLERIYGAIGTKEEDKVLEKEYEKAPSEQIDTAISEKADNILIVPGDFGWSDVGDWKVVYDISDKDKAGNVLTSNKEGNLIEIGSRNCLIETNGRLVVAIGLENIAIIDTEDAILITSLDKTQDVKKAVEKLKEAKKAEYL